MEIEDIVRALRGDRIRITDHADIEAIADDLSFDEARIAWGMARYSKTTLMTNRFRVA